MELPAYEKEHVEVLRSYLAECMVLLQSNGDFPLKEAGRIALYGSGARRTIKGGTGSGEVNSRYFVTVEDGLKNAGFEVTTSSWLDAYDRICEREKQKFIKDIRTKAKASHQNVMFAGMGAVMPEPEYELPLDGEGDIAVYVLARISGEGNDRNPGAGDVCLSTTEKRDILALHRKYPKFMLVLNVGGAMDLSGVEEVENILLLSQLGVETGNALADVLLGKETPSGKLATTWCKADEISSIGEFGGFNDTRYKEGIYVGYRYFDTVGKRAAYPFGYGLSYTTFSHNVKDVQLHGDTVKLCIDVENRGDFSGKEIMQVYLSCPQGRIDKEWQSLAGWGKTEKLAPKEKQRVMISFQLRDFASYDMEKECYVLEAGEYLLRAGSDSVNTKICAVIILEQDVITKKVKNLLGNPDFTDWKPEEQRSKGEVPIECRKLILDPSAIPMNEVSYKYEYEIDPLIEQLTEEQLAHLNVGAFSPKGSIVSVIGNAASLVAGAAGESSSIAKREGILPLVMADGPAGLRLAKDYIKDDKGAYALGPTLPATMTELLSPFLRWILGFLEKKPKNGQTIEHHYMTALPIGTAIAQSWNLEFAGICGRIVGNEMQRSGVHLWLAPALNIHRTILCGRNFEYYSEDPVISGYFAAALTQGVQEFEGCGVTIKHFAANNQEYNRYNNNSQVSERAMREIYLKGFEISVRESQPHALMTSYNLVNGVHTSESRALAEDILRREFYFKGIVMTDWIVPMGMKNKDAIYAFPNAGNIAATGCELVMPGGKQDVEQICEALQSGKLSKKQLQINATRLYHMTKKLVRNE